MIWMCQNAVGDLYIRIDRMRFVVLYFKADDGMHLRTKLDQNEIKII